MGSRQVLSRRRFLAGSAGAAMLVALPSLTSPASATSTDVRKINANGVRLRSAPGTGSSVIASISSGTEVRYLEPGGSASGYEWTKIKVISSGSVGYVASQFLSPITPPGGGGQFAIGSTVHVDAAGGKANLRSSPNGSVTRVLNNGLSGTVVDGPQQGGGYTWYKINFGDVQGWMATVVLAAGGGSDRPMVQVADGPLNVRRNPGTSSAIVGTAQTGRKGYITTQMPQEANGYVWVHVQFTSGLEGWVAKQFLAYL
jgi:N-acetylmuramoyl-L-alanine amidase